MARCSRCAGAFDLVNAEGLCPVCSLEGILAAAGDLAGETFGQYEVVCAIGEGGLAIVYLAEQRAPVHREVALKVVKPGGGAARALDRFQSEIRILAALDHPGIARVIDAGRSSAGRPFFVMEFVDGAPLTEHCDRHRLRVEDRVALLASVCDAVEYAHRRGVLHRDLKPPNILVALTDGRAVPKVIDFGIAKDAGLPAEEAPLHTRHGELLGTPEYMSPEQAEAGGGRLDATTDVYSLGVVLYELLCGRLPLEAGRLRAAPASEIGKVLRSTEPPALASSLRAAVERDEIAAQRSVSAEELERRLSGPLEAIVQRALAKDPARRYGSADSLGADLRRFLNREPPAAAPSRRAASSFLRSRRVLWLAAAAAALFASAALGLYRISFRSTGESWHSLPFATSSGYQSFPAFSPDGSRVAFTWAGDSDGVRRVYIQGFTNRALVQATDGSSDQTRPAWSPDGKRIAFVQLQPGGGKEVQVRDLESGAISNLAALGGNGPWLCNEPHLSWSRDGAQIASVEQPKPERPCAIVAIDVATGRKHALTNPDARLLADVEPAFSPDGSWLAFLRLRATSIGDIFVAPAAGGAPRRVTFDNREIRGFAWSGDGRSLIVASRREGVFVNLWRIALDGKPPVKLTEGPNYLGFPSVAAGASRIAYVNYRDDYNIWKSRSGSNSLCIESRSTDWDPQYSPDGARIAFVSDRTGVSNLWLADACGGNPTALTEGDSPAGSVAWSPDGKRIAFDLRVDGQSDVYLIEAPPTPLAQIEKATPRRLTTWASNESVPSWSRDGRFVYFASNRAGGSDIYRVAPAGGAPARVTQNGALRAIESPDGRELYYVKPTGGIWKKRLDAPAETPVLAAFGANDWANWTLDARGLYYWLRDAAPAAAAPYALFLSSPGSAAPVALGHAGKRPLGLSVSPDGTAFLFAQLDQSGSDILVLER